MIALILEGSHGNTVIGGLSLVERAVLAAQRAGLGSSTVVWDAHPPREMTTRLDARGVKVTFVGWEALQTLDLSGGALVIRDSVLVEPRALTALLDDFNAGLPHTVLVAGGLDDDPDLALIPADSARMLRGMTSEHQFLLRLRSITTKRRVALGPRFCRRIAAVSDVPYAERDYIRCQDGGESESFFTKRIRWFSRPLSRVLARHGATPTQVTMAGLMLAIGAAIAISRGTYLASLAGALLAYASMVLDCSDGEVARLSFRDSPFGAWLETFVDYASYFLLLGGLVLGSQHRESADLYRTAAGVALAASVLVALVTGYLRHRVAGADPGQFDDASVAVLGKASPFHRFAAWGRQWIKRSTVAHLVVVLALVNQLQVLIYLWAFGAVVALAIFLALEPFLVRRVKVAAFAQGGK